MSYLTGIDRVVYGVENLATATRFFADWGLSLVQDEDEFKVFETLEKSQVVLRLIDDSTLPSAIEEGPTVREVVWGAATQAGLDEFLTKIAKHIELEYGEDGIARCVDPNGLSVGFQLSQRIKVDVVGTPTNTFDKAFRIDQPAPVYDRATPVRIAHVVFFVEDLEAHRAFYIDILGFQITDGYPGRGFFSRCVDEGTHHNLFLLQVPNKAKGINHVSFQLSDIYEVMGGGLHFSGCGWDTQLGPGRHPISSAFFWYFESPGGGLVEYYTDEDYLTDKWQPRLDLEPTPENYAEWAVSGGLDAETRRQKFS
jgi:catechol 2,3-dioxygenase-like lactoylglutathione lyase family enzyme